MIYDNWMSYIKDDVRLCSLVIPGSHNAGSYGMMKMAECQKDRLLTQFRYGVRQFCLRLDTDRKGKIVLAHGIAKGDSFENVLCDIRTIIEHYPTEILLLDLREYYPSKIGPVTIKPKADKHKVDALLEKYISPEKYAFCDFDKIGDVTVGDIRRAGKRYIIINPNEDYKFSRSCDCIFPWEKAVNGSHAKSFAAQTLRFFDDYSTDGLYWFQTQQTPNLGTEVGLTTPIKLDYELREYFKDIIKGIENNPAHLERANIIAGDFMTYDYMKSEAILRLNLLKNNVNNELATEYAEGLKWN